MFRNLTWKCCSADSRSWCNKVIEAASYSSCDSLSASDLFLFVLRYHGSRPTPLSSLINPPSYLNREKIIQSRAITKLAEKRLDSKHKIIQPLFSKTKAAMKKYVQHYILLNISITNLLSDFENFDIYN